MKIKTKIKKFLFRKENNKKPEDRLYFFGDLSINLKSEHLLDNYQKRFPLYDRFLPILCEKVKGLIIDVGANIGDTSIAIFSKNNESFIVGVEPDTVFFQECEKNITRNNLQERFLGIKKFLSTNKGSYVIEKSKTLSTGSIANSAEIDAEINTISFLDLMNLVPFEKKNEFDILKIDTDGFDWDVLNSFTEYLSVAGLKPKFVFFEMQSYLNNVGIKDVNRELISNKYRLAIEKLVKNGYDYFVIFDNFGTPMKVTQSINDIFEIDTYLRNSNLFNSNCTIYYLDILAFSVDQLQMVNQCLNQLLEKKDQKIKNLSD